MERSDVMESPINIKLMWTYIKRKWLFLLIVLILLVLNVLVWSFLWEEETKRYQPVEVHALPENVT